MSFESVEVMSTPAAAAADTAFFTAARTHPKSSLGKWYVRHGFTGLSRKAFGVTRLATASL